MNNKINKKKSLKELLRNTALATVALIFVILLYALQPVIDTIGENVKEGITADDLLTSNAIVFKGPPPPNDNGGNDGGNGDDTNETGDDDEEEEEPPFTNETLLCWYEGGLQYEDIISFGHIIKDIPCNPGKKQTIIATLENDCIDVTIGDEATTELCPSKGAPTININFGEAIPSEQPQGIEKRENYANYILFFIAFIILFFFWREYELRRSTEKTKTKETKKRKKVEIKSKAPKKEIIYVKKAPLYDVRKAEREKRRREKIANVLDEEQKRKGAAKAVRRNKLIKIFNAAAMKINQLILKGDIQKARGKYIELFNTYSELVTHLEDANQRRVDNVMEYLSNYLSILENIKQKEQQYAHQEKKKIDKATMKPKAKMLSMEELNQLKKRIKKRNHARAKAMADTSIEETFDVDKAAHNVVEKDEDTKSIELRHNKLLQRGAVSIDKDDYHHFMSSMEKLRKSLEKKHKRKRKKH